MGGTGREYGSRRNKEVERSSSDLAEAADSAVLRLLAAMLSRGAKHLVCLSKHPWSAEGELVWEDA